MLDAVLIERRGTPAAVIGAEKLLSTTGKAMARAQGLPDLPFAYIDHPSGIMTASGEEANITEVLPQAAADVDGILVQPAAAHEGVAGQRDDGSG